MEVQNEFAPWTIFSIANLGSRNIIIYLQYDSRVVTSRKLPTSYWCYPVGTYKREGVSWKYIEPVGQ